MRLLALCSHRFLDPRRSTIENFPAPVAGMSPARTADDLPLPEITHYRQHRRAAKTYQQLGGIRLAPEEQPSVFWLEHLEAAKRAVPAPVVGQNRGCSVPGKPFSSVPTGMERSTANFFLLSLDMVCKGELLHKNFLLPAKALILRD